MGTASGLRTRRYHALLSAAVEPPRRRMVLVNGLETFVELPDGRQLALSSHLYRGGVIHPDGVDRIGRFTWQPWPRWEFLLEDGSTLAEEVLVAPGAARVVVRWRRDGAGPARLSVRPLLSGRDHHALHRENPAFRFAAEEHGDFLVWRPYPGVPAVTARATGKYSHAPDWRRRFVYSEEAARGFECEEDLAAPGIFVFDMGTGPAVLVLAAGEPGTSTGFALDPAAFAQDSFAAEAARRRALRTSSSLAAAADAYPVQGKAGETIIAGYPWFDDWGRDTFIALRGLCLSTGRLDDARRILLSWITSLSAGMLPNRFVEDGVTPEYNSVDASLWFVVASDALLARPEACTAGEQKEIEDAVQHVVAGYAGGTRHGIGAARDGLLSCGRPDTQLTWMDARVHGRAVTPRVGKPVEVQALWVNALAIAGRGEPRWSELLSRASAAFGARFWNPSRRMLFDVVDVDHQSGRVDDRFRPNQIFAVGGGLPVALVEGARARAVVDAVERALWTPAGLRSLAQGEPGYAGLYRGSPIERDAAYHQGTAWTWLIGPFVEAWVRVRGGGPGARTEARRRFLEPLLARTAISGLGHLGEIADGDPPHTARGCPFQAWSVAEALRLDVDVLGARDAQER
jgi:predicted glycogen debranching enzyme